MGIGVTPWLDRPLLPQAIEMPLMETPPRQKGKTQKRREFFAKLGLAFSVIHLLVIDLGVDMIVGESGQVEVDRGSGAAAPEISEAVKVMFVWSVLAVFITHMLNYVQYHSAGGKKGYSQDEALLPCVANPCESQTTNGGESGCLVFYLMPLLTGAGCLCMTKARYLEENWPEDYEAEAKKLSRMGTILIFVGPLLQSLWMTLLSLCGTAS